FDCFNDSLRFLQPRALRRRDILNEFTSVHFGKELRRQAGRLSHGHEEHSSYCPHDESLMVQPPPKEGLVSVRDTFEWIEALPDRGQRTPYRPGSFDLGELGGMSKLSITGRDGDRSHGQRREVRSLHRVGD